MSPMAVAGLNPEAEEQLEMVDQNRRISGGSVVFHLKTIGERGLKT